MKADLPQPMRKVTMNLPAQLVDEAPAVLGKNSFTEAVRDALKDALHREACKRMLAMRGKIDLQIDLAALREDRDI